MKKYGAVGPWALRWGLAWLLGNFWLAGAQEQVSIGHGDWGDASFIITEQDLPADANVFLKTHTPPGPVPFKLRGHCAMECKAVRNGRECMGIDQLTPIFFGWNCSGQHCDMKMTPGPCSCMLREYGVDVQKTNKTRSSTCGLAEEDSHWLHPLEGQLGIDDFMHAVYGLPPGAFFGLWAKCVDGGPALKARLTLKEKLPEFYNCIANPVCGQDKYKTSIVCYTTRTGNRYGEAIGEEPVANHVQALPSTGALALSLIALVLVTLAT